MSLTLKASPPERQPLSKSKETALSALKALRRDAQPVFRSVRSRPSPRLAG